MPHGGVKPSTILSENTKFTAGIVIVLVGFSFWLAVMYFQGDANAKAIEELRGKQDAIGVIQTDIAVIKTKLGDIEHKIDGRNGGD